MKLYRYEGFVRHGGPNTLEAAEAYYRANKEAFPIYNSAGNLFSLEDVLEKISMDRSNNIIFFVMELSLNCEKLKRLMTNYDLPPSRIIFCQREPIINGKYQVMKEICV